jgi:hypothetical protein
MLTAMFAIQFYFGIACCLSSTYRDGPDASDRKLDRYLNSHLGAKTKNRHWGLGLKPLADSAWNNADPFDDGDFHCRKIFASENAYSQRFSQSVRMLRQGDPVKTSVV